MMTSGIDKNAKDDGFSVAYCAGYVGIALAVLGIVTAALAHFKVQDPFWMGVVLLVLAVIGFYTLLAFWFLVRAFKAINILLLAVCGVFTGFFSVKSVIIPLVPRPLESPFLVTLGTALIHSPVLIFLAASVALAAALLKAKKRPPV
jgi:hypothetical protein